MGVRGLTSFLEHKSPHIDIDVLRDDKHSPIIVIDFISLTYTLFDAKDLICGGRFGVIFDHFENLLQKLKDIGAKLVFFYRMTVDKFSNHWIAKCREKFALNIKMYDEIRDGKTLNEIAAVLSKDGSTKNPPLASSELNAIAQKYGECFFSTDCDLEMALFAKKNNARAIVSDSSNFFIFDGDWKYWSAKEFKIDPRNHNKIKTAQFDRNGIVKSCGIDAIHRPLFATLIGNDLASDDLRDDLKQFQKSLGKPRFLKVAQYAKNAKRHKNGLLDFERISKDVFGVCEDEYIKFLQSSVNSYKLDDVPEKEHNEIFSRLSTTGYNRDISKILSARRIFLLSFYDMRGKCVKETLPMVFMKWHQRKSGILSGLFEHDSVGKVFAKFKYDEDFRLVPYEAIKPEFTVPDIENWYFNSEATDIKWEMFAFIMGLDDIMMTAIKSLPREFRLVSTALLVLVKGGFLTKDEADGVLSAMHMVETDESTVRKMKHSALFRCTEIHIRAAHIFNNTVDQVRQNFVIAGLLSVIQPSRFDGMYFQHVMRLTVVERNELMIPCQAYRIYNHNNTIIN